MEQMDSMRHSESIVMTVITAVLYFCAIMTAAYLFTMAWSSNRLLDLLTLWLQCLNLEFSFASPDGTGFERNLEIRKNYYLCRSYTPKTGNLPRQIAEKPSRWFRSPLKSSYLTISWFHPKNFFYEKDSHFDPHWRNSENCIASCWFYWSGHVPVLPVLVCLGAESPIYTTIFY